MLFTRKGDKGDTGLFGCDQRISKSSAIAEALGVLDETNSFLGVCKVKAQKEKILFKEQKVSDVTHQIQENLFIIQSQIAGSDKKIKEIEIIEMENLIGEIENKLPEIKSFFISGGSELSSFFDFARTLVRRAERMVVAVSEEEIVNVGENTLKYLNRLSSLLYALSRLVNFDKDVKEKIPKY